MMTTISPRPRIIRLAPPPINTSRDAVISTAFSSSMRLLAILIASLVCFTSSVGCKNLVQRSQSPDNFALPLKDKKEKTKVDAGYIVDICVVDGLNYAPTEGIGLAFGLRDTGSNPKPGGQREYLVKQLEAKREDLKIEPLLAGKDTELVLMKGLLPPGIRKGETFDVEIGTLKTTDGTSLENGMISQTGLRPMQEMGRSVQKGHVNAVVRGRILTDSLFESRNDRPNQMKGYILGGGVATDDRNLGLVIRDEDFSPQTSINIARAVNSRFTFVDKNGRQGVAEPKTDRYVEIKIPDEYRHNIGRYLQVVVNLVHSETATQRLERMQTLERDLLDPAKAGLTAVRLEALGSDGVPILKRALRHEDLEVRFEAAQALAYMNETDGVDILHRAAQAEPAFRWNALAALATLKDPAAGKALTDLMQVKSAETRYGAFRSMLARSPNDPLMIGVTLGDFTLHRIPSKTENPMLHFSRQKRAEIVVFGEDQTVGDKFLHVEAGLTIRSTGNGTVSISRFSVDRGEERQFCSNRIGELTEALARAGMSYGDLLKMYRTAKNNGDLNTRLVVNAVPKLGRSYVPGQSADEPEPEVSERYISDDLPGMFNDGSAKIGVPMEGGRKTFTSQPTLQNKPDSKTSARSETLDTTKPSTFDRMSGWFKKKD